MKRLSRLLSPVVVFLACSSIAPALCADTWYVDGSIPASGDGTSWGSAFATIQDGIDAATNGDTVIVARGTYVENIRFRGQDIILRSTDPLDPEVVANTIIDGNQTASVVAFYGTEDASCVLSGFTIRNGKPAGPGGGIHGYEGLATIRYNIITGNSAERGGGGLAYCNGTIEHNVISKNFVTVGGGAGLFSCYATIRNNLIMQNSGEREGGGMKDCWGSIVNNVIVGNSTTKEGGGISWCSGEILNNTIVANSAANDGGGVHICNGTIMNCIVWGNSAPSNAQISSSATPTYCCVQGGAGGAGNINQNPLFAGPDDYGLSVDSPCIDTGYNASELPETDIAGMPRITFGGKSLTVDMGAHEFMPPDNTPPVIALLGDSLITLEVGSPYVEPGYTATDDRDGDITPSVQVTGSVEHTLLGSYDLCYNASDSSGNPAEEQTRTVNVVDRTPPVISLLGDNPMILEMGTPYSEPGYTATDNYNGDITGNVEITGSVEHTIPGTYTVRYNVVDSSSNPAEEQARTVDVLDTTPFDIAGIVEPVTGMVQLTWSSRLGETFAVWSCSDLREGPWRQEATLPARYEFTSWVDTAAAVSKIKFYRIERQ